jgi:hypothetical protein
MIHAVRLRCLLGSELVETRAVFRIKIPLEQRFGPGNIG